MKNIKYIEIGDRIFREDAIYHVHGEKKTSLLDGLEDVYKKIRFVTISFNDVDCNKSIYGYMHEDEWYMFVGSFFNKTNLTDFCFVEENEDEFKNFCYARKKFSPGCEIAELLNLY